MNIKKECSEDVLDTEKKENCTEDREDKKLSSTPKTTIIGLSLLGLALPIGAYFLGRKTSKKKKIKSDPNEHIEDATVIEIETITRKSFS